MKEGEALYYDGNNRSIYDINKNYLGKAIIVKSEDYILLPELIIIYSPKKLINKIFYKPVLIPYYPKLRFNQYAQFHR